MNSNQIKEITLSLLDTFKEAGNVALELREKGLKNEIKSDNTPVTNGDIEVNNILTKKISSITPEIPIISEETSSNKKDKNLENFWLIDPIDGTGSYINNKDEFTLNAALIINKKPVSGIIHAPGKNRLFYSYGPLNSFEVIDSKEINLSKENFINLKIDAESDYGQELFTQFNGSGYPLIIFLDEHGLEIDRFYGYLHAYEFIIKMEDVISGQNTFTYYLEEYDKNNHTAEILKPLADKYKDKGNDELALDLYKQLIASSNISKEDYKIAQYNIASLSLKNNQIQYMITYLEKLTKNYPIISLEDPLNENSWAGFSELTKKIGKKTHFLKVVCHRSENHLSCLSSVMTSRLVCHLSGLS